MGMGLRGMVWGLWGSEEEFNDFVLWWEVRGGQGLLGLGVRWEEPHFWVLTVVKDLPQLSPAAALAVTHFGICQGGLGGNEAPSSPKRPWFPVLPDNQHSTWACPLGWSCPICGRWCRTGVLGFPSASPAWCGATAHPVAPSAPSQYQSHPSNPRIMVQAFLPISPVIFHWSKHPLEWTGTLSPFT